MEIVEEVLTADFEVQDADKFTGVRLQFINRSSAANGYSWDFGDGGASQARNPRHKYRKAGAYTVILTATDDDGGSDQASADVVVASRYKIQPVSRQPNTDRVLVSVKDMATGELWTEPFDTVRDSAVKLVQRLKARIQTEAQDVDMSVLQEKVDISLSE